jgi:hypothetical protein
MESCCQDDSTDFIFPMKADVFYAVTEPTAYGNVSKTWILDKTVACNFVDPGLTANTKSQVIPDPNIKFKSLLEGRVRTDIRISKRELANAITNIIITNIRDKNGAEIYLETSGTRAGKSTIFEISSQNPFLNPFGNIDYYSLTLLRSENQGVDV